MGYKAKYVTIYWESLMSLNFDEFPLKAFRRNKDQRIEAQSTKVPLKCYSIHSKLNKI